MDIDPKEITQSIVKFLKDSFRSAGFTRAVIALSGGLDSSTSCVLAVKALGKENIYPVLLPYGNLNKNGSKDALLVINSLKIPKRNVTQVDIAALVEPIFSLDKPTDLIRKGNIMARMRMIVLFDQAKKRKALVVGTENKSEHLLSYFTRFGDEASDIEPLRSLYKTQVYQLAKYLSVPKSIITKKPTAGLWEGQTDEGEFGFTYKDADEILFYLYDGNKTVGEIVKDGFKRETVEKVKAWVEKNDFKHNLPFVCKS